MLCEHGSPASCPNSTGPEGPRSGEVIYLTHLGVCSHCGPELGVRAAGMTMEDEQPTVRRRRCRILRVAGAIRRPPRCLAANPPTTPSVPSLATPERAAEFVMAPVTELDRRA
jgi:hypothetical protein